MARGSKMEAFFKHINLLEFALRVGGGPVTVFVFCRIMLSSFLSSSDDLTEPAVPWSAPPLERTG